MPTTRPASSAAWARRRFAAVIVPYPHHKDRQQLRNAEVLARAGAAVIVEEPQLTVERLTDLLQALFADPQRLAAMGRAARALQTGDPVATILADMGVADLGGEQAAAAAVIRTVAGGAS